jgi:SAM-dependent methyltransferase
MSFWPFPKILLDELRCGAANGRAVEIGSGDGGLTRRMRQVGIDPTTIDLRAPADIRADARALPLRPRVCGVVVVGNLMRHLPAASRAAVFEELEATLAPSGRIAVFEDHPEARDRAEENYRTVLDLLRRADPARGGVLDLDELAGALPEGLERRVDLVLDNEESVIDPARPLAWLRARGFSAEPGFGKLCASVERVGMRYGRYRAWVLGPVGAGIGGLG